MDVINNIINALISQFDFTYCVIVNIMTYLIINFMIKVAGGNVVVTIKRIVLLFSIIVIAAIYYFLGTDIKVLVNSSILAPVSWSWIIEPILAKFGYDYKDIDKRLN
mgnify:CR=1 FL=1